MAKQRSSGEGTVSKRPSNRYQAQVSIEGRRLTKTFDTNQEAVRWLRTMANKKDDGYSLKGTKVLVRDFCENWIETIKPSIQPKTVYQYEGILNKHVLPQLGGLKLIDLGPTEIQSFYFALQKDGVGARTRQLIHAVLKNALGKAEKWGLLLSNPIRLVDRPVVKKKETRVMDQNEIKNVIRAANGIWIKPILQIALVTGMRQGELLGLQWLDIDWAMPGIHIRRQLQRIPNEGLQLKIPKTKRSIRTVSIGTNTVSILMDHRNLQEMLFGDRIDPSDPIFCRPDGSFIRPRTLLREFKTTLKRAGLRDSRFHDLRHTYASHMLALNVPIANLSHQMGHANLSTTLNTYGHLMPGIESQVVAQLDGLLAPVAAELQRSDSLEHEEISHGSQKTSFPL